MILITMRTKDNNLKKMDTFRKAAFSQVYECVSDNGGVILVLLVFCIVIIVSVWLSGIYFQKNLNKKQM